MNKKIVLGIVLLVIVALAALAYTWNQSSPVQAVQQVASTTAPGTAGATHSTGGSASTGTTGTKPVNHIQYPTLSTIKPDAAKAGTSVSLLGSGFAAGSQVLIGSGAITQVTVNGTGTMITFTLPASVGAYCKAGQACPQYLLQLTPGTYDLSVVNTDGSKSNKVPFVVSGS